VKRIILCAGLIAVSALAATAMAATSRPYRGQVKAGGIIRFRADMSGGQIVDVKGLAWHGVAIRCDQGRFRFRGGFAGQTFPVNGGTFRAHGSAGSAHVSYARVVGTFRAHGARATGTLRIHGSLDAQHTNCDSHAKAWSAHRVG
jgi:hypothetical protein